MELNSGNSQTDEDMASRLMDDVLLSILGRVNLITAMRASVLSKRWRHLPWLLSQLSIDANDFFYEPYGDPTVDDHIDKAMSSLADAVMSMVAPTHRNSVITKLCISFFLTSSYSSEIGRLVNEAIENGMVKDIELTSGIERLPFDVSDEEMVKHAASIHGFFGKYPNISGCLRSLLLYNATFAESDLHDLLAKTCTQLHYLYLYQCDTGINTLFKIDAPNSKLNVLEFAHCSWKQVEEVEIFSATAAYQNKPFKLSELLCDATCVNILTLDFQGQKIWLQPEKDQLHSAFCNLKELALHGIFVGFGLLWAAAFIEAAPSLEILDIEVWSHICYNEEEKKEIYGERTNAKWDVSEFAQSSKPLPLKQLQLCGFNSTEEHIVFIGAVMELAFNLRTIVLKEHYCEDCSAISTSVPSGECRFPRNEDEQELLVNKLRNRFSSCAQIIFSPCKLSSD